MFFDFFELALVDMYLNRISSIARIQIFYTYLFQQFDNIIVIINHLHLHHRLQCKYHQINFCLISQLVLIQFAKVFFIVLFASINSINQLQKVFRYRCQLLHSFYFVRVLSSFFARNSSFDSFNFIFCLSFNVIERFSYFDFYRYVFFFSRFLQGFRVTSIFTDQTS